MLVAKILIEQRKNFELQIRDAAIVDQLLRAQALQSTARIPDRQCVRVPRAHSSNSGTAGTAMYNTLRKCRLDAL